MPKAGIQFAKKDDWATPKKVIDVFGPFDYDPATTEELAKKFGIPNYDTIDTDGLNADWTKFKKIWCNPPFSRKFEFLSKAVQSIEKMDTCAEIFFLIPIDSLTTKSFHNIITGASYDLIIPDGRINFEDKSGSSKSSPAFGSAILRITNYMTNDVRQWRMNGEDT